MNVIARTPATKRVPMDSLRKTALVAGILYLATFVSIPILALYAPALNDPNWVTGPGPDTPILIGGVLEVIVALAGIGTAVALYPVVKRQNGEGRAGLRRHAGPGSRRPLRRRGGPAVPGDPAPVRSRSGRCRHRTGARRPIRLVVPPRGSLMPAMNALLLGSLLYRSGLVPRILPILGLIGAPLLLASDFAVLFGLWDRVSLQSGIAAIPIAIWEFSLGVYLIVKRFQAFPHHCRHERRRQRPPREPARHGLTVAAPARIHVHTE